MTYTYTFTGPRSYADADAVDRAMRDALVAEDAAIRVRVGDCPTGADLFVREWCAANLPARCLEVWRADWKRFGRAADGSEIRYQAFLDIDLSTADPFGLKVGRFYDRHPLGRYLSGQGPVPRTSWMDPYDIIEDPRDMAVEIARLTHGAYVVGAVPQFDTEVFDKLVRSAKLAPAWHYHLIDVETLAAGQLGMRPPWDFDVLLGEYGLTYDEADRHTAMGDALMAEKLYDAVMARGDRERAARHEAEARELYPFQCAACRDGQHFACNKAEQVPAGRCECPCATPVADHV